MSRSLSKIDGFTLTELMIVVTVAGVLAVFAIPSFTSLNQSQQVKNFSFELYSSMALARSEAIKRNSNVTITAQTNTKQEVSWTITATGGTVIRNQDYFKGVNMRVCNIATGSNGFAYNRNGRATNLNGSQFTPSAPTFEIYAANTTAASSPFTRCLTLELSGMPRIRQGVCPPCPT